MRNNIPVIFSTDNNYVMPTGVAILSLLESAKPTTVYNIFVLINDDVTEESKNLLRKQVECFPNHSIDFINVGKVFENSFEIRDISIATYSRLLIPWLLPQYNKVIYADVDMIFHIDLSDVYNIDMKDNLVAGVYAISFYLDSIGLKHLESIGLKGEAYINAGFLIVNSSLQREYNLINQFLDEAKKKYTFQDQDIINLVCKRKKNILPLKYNISSGYYNLFISNNSEYSTIWKESEIFKLSPNLADCMNEFKQYKNCILHYAGKKPWNTFTQAWREWWNTYQRSIFYNPEREIRVSQSILRPIPTWRSIAGQIKRKLLTEK